MGDHSKNAHESGKTFIPNEFSDHPYDIDLKKTRQYLRKYLAILTGTLFQKFPKLLNQRQIDFSITI